MSLRITFHVVKLLVLSFLINCSYQHKNEVNVFNQSSEIITPLNRQNVSKFFVKKLMQKFGNHTSMNIEEFELMLKVLQSSFVTESSNSLCIDGLKFLNSVENQKEVNITNDFSIDEEHLFTVCPILVHHIIDQKPFGYEASCIEELEETSEIESRSSVWFYSTLAIIGISLCGLSGVAVIPIVDKNYYFYVLQFFMALAVGTLTGDALLHLLPHAMRPSSDDMSSSELIEMMMHRGIAALFGIILFCFIERILNMITSYKDHKKLPQHKAHNEENDSLQKQSNHHGHSHGFKSIQKKSLSSIVWMVILGDGLHNFTDGMAIGAAFSNNIAGGFSTTLAVFCHELPHEMGDFAVLLKAGMPARQAIYYNILSSVLSFFGMCFGILIGETPETTQWVFALAAGLFIYIALVDMMPELSAPKTKDENFSIIQFVLQLSGMLSGFGAMLLIAIYEEKLETLFTA